MQMEIAFSDPQVLLLRIIGGQWAYLTIELINSFQPVGSISD